MDAIPHKTPPFGYFPRPEFTEQVRRRMVEFRTNLALFAPRRRGKTTWALLELQPATAAWGLEFAYLNLWANRSDPVGVLAKGLEIAAGLRPDDGSTREAEAEIAASLFKVRAKKVYPPVTPDIMDRVRIAIEQMAKRQRRTLLVIDEFQAIAEADKGAAAISAFRTALEAHGDKVVALFTGSERSTLAKMFRAQTAPLLDQAKLLDLPELEDEFIQDRVSALQAKGGPALTLKEASKAFSDLGKSPLLLNEALTELAVRTGLTLSDAVAEVIDHRGREDYGVQVAALPELDRAVLYRIASGQKPYTDLEGLPRKKGGEVVDVPTVQSIVNRLAKKCLIESKHDRKTGWIIPDPVLEKWVKKTSAIE